MGARKKTGSARRAAPRKPAAGRLPPWLWPAIVAAVAVVALVAWVVARGGGEDRVAGADDPGVVHVHGLGVNPKDGTLYAATHTGLFRIPRDGRALRVADRYQDTMGFTVVGPDRFLGSGHPDLEEMREKRLPPLLGLIESTDAGHTWRPLSLRGEADFHGLRAAHGRIYGYDSTGGSFMVSADGKSWDRRARLPVLDFAVSPADPEVIVAATPAGVQRSGDGGRTWERMNAPSLAVLAWEQPDALLGIAANGAVYQSGDGGAGWRQQGALGGPPAAFLAAGATLYAATHDGGIYLSQNGGVSWQLRYRDPGPSPSARR